MTNKFIYEKKHQAPSIKQYVYTIHTYSNIMHILLSWNIAVAASVAAAAAVAVTAVTAAIAYDSNGKKENSCLATLMLHLPHLNTILKTHKWHIITTAFFSFVSLCFCFYFEKEGKRWVWIKLKARWRCNKIDITEISFGFHTLNHFYWLLNYNDDEEIKSRRKRTKNITCHWCCSANSAHYH